MISAINHNNQTDVTGHLCQVCEKPLKGRADKKFCNQICRNIYNNKFIHTVTETREIDRILKRNRKILQKVLGDGEIVTVNKRVLIELNFNFTYQTHRRKEKRKRQTVCCYEFGYMQNNNADIVICKIKNLPGNREEEH